MQETGNPLTRGARYLIRRAKAGIYGQKFGLVGESPIQADADGDCRQCPLTTHCGQMLASAFGEPMFEFEASQALLRQFEFAHKLVEPWIAVQITQAGVVPHRD